MTNKKKILLLRRMTDDFIFTANYNQLLADKIVEWGFHLFIYDHRSRKLIDYNNKKVKQYFSVLSIFDSTFFRIPINIVSFIVFSLRHTNNYDIVHIKYLREEYFVLSRFVKRLAPKLFITIFGSDINFHAGIKKYFKKIFWLADKIIFSNESLKYQLYTFFDTKESIEKLDGKIQTSMVPLKSVELLDNGIDHQQIANVRSKFALSENEILVLCGTTGKIAYEQMDKLIEVIDSSMINDSKIVLMISLTYAGNEQEKNKFIQNAKSKFKEKNIRFLTDYLELSELLALRTITDIFINLRTHDQMVASMIESFFCKSHVITGTWLPYSILREKGFTYYPVDAVEEVPDRLKNIVEKIQSDKAPDLSHNRELVKKLWHPKVALEDWLRIYKE